MLSHQSAAEGVATGAAHPADARRRALSGDAPVASWYARAMSKLLAVVAGVLLLTTPAAASMVRYNLTKATQATSPVQYALRTSMSHGFVTVDLEVPRKQAVLDHLWRIDLVLLKDNKTLLSAPLETKLDGDVLKTSLLLDPDAIKRTEIWIRVGEHAPLAETVYAIDVGSFK
jgi:hypothetical protein